ncbi:hypothetical protein H920_08259 [Fukomys damarensis]|uniref:Uncharacterized protein n=1 Tax=Fukomys damarensis TaxID=885580 RepID=A0A091DJ86_FUKDA|nr:hypothetical protein H920_08259 [Fukomys damarensis]
MTSSYKQKHAQDRRKARKQVSRLGFPLRSRRDCSRDKQPSFWVFADQMSASIWRHELEMPASLGWASGSVD